MFVTCQLISSRNCNTGKSKLITRSLNGFTTRPWVDLIIINATRHHHQQRLLLAIMHLCIMYDNIAG
jgi:hypothetical protein